jgi:hypothetical protein
MVQWGAMVKGRNHKRDRRSQLQMDGDIASLTGVCVDGLWLGRRLSALPESGIHHSTHTQHHLVVLLIPNSSTRCSRGGEGKVVMLFKVQPCPERN